MNKQVLLSITSLLADPNPDTPLMAGIGGLEIGQGDMLKD